MVDRPATPTRAALLLVLALTCIPVGCTDEGAAAPPSTVEGRPDDGLLGDPDLQRVVDHQVDRDGEALVALLDDSSPAVRARAAFALGSVQDAAAAAPLIDALGDVSPRVRADAAFALGQYGSGGAATVVLGPASADARRVASALVELLEDEDDRRVRRAAVEALGKIGAETHLDALARMRDPRLESDVALALSRSLVRGVRSPRALERLAGGLTHLDPDVRLHSAYFFGRSDAPERWSPVRERVRLALAGYALDDPAAMWLVQGLGRTGDVSVRDEIRRWARDAEDWRIRVNAVRALGERVPDDETVRVYLDALDDPSVHVRIAAVGALGSFALRPATVDRLRRRVAEDPGDWRTADRLLAVLARNGEGAWVLERLDAIPRSERERWILGVAALTWVDDPAAVDLLEELLGSPHPTVAREAMDALSRRWVEDQPLEPSADRYWRIFSEALSTGDPAVTWPAARAVAGPELWRRGGLERITDAWERTAEEDVRARVALVGALEEADDPAAEPLLREALGDPSPAVRRAAASALVAVVGGSVAIPSQEEVGGEGEERPADLPAFLGERIDWSRLAGLGPHPLLRIETDRGSVTLRLDAVEAPQTVQSVAELALAGRYDGSPFHRVVPNFVVQGGDFARGDGSGGPGYRIRSELTRIPYRRGVVGMASSGKDTEGSQLFVTHAPQPHLDGGWTAFGRVVDGMEVVDRLQIGDRIERARIEPGR